MQRRRDQAGSRGTRAVLLGGAVSGVSAYAFQIVGARGLGESAYAPVAVLWTMQYLVLTVGLLSAEAYVTSNGGRAAGVWRWIGLLTVAVTVTVTVFDEVLLGTDAAVWPIAAAQIVLGLGVLTVARGRAAAQERFVAYGLLSGAEAAVRLALGVVVVLTLERAAPLALILGSGPLVAGGIWLLANKSSDPSAVGDVVDTAGVGGAHPASPSAAARFLAPTTLANAIAQGLLAGGPLLTAALGADPGVTTSVFVTTTAARGPLVFVYSGLLARILPPVRHAVRNGDDGELAGRLRRSGPVVLALMVAAGIAGALAGPPLVALAFGADLRPSALFAALTSVAVVAAVAGLLANQVVIAYDAPHILPPTWLLAGAVGTLSALLVTTSPSLRAGWASAAGLVTAFALLWLRLTLRGRRATEGLSSGE